MPGAWFGLPIPGGRNGRRALRREGLDQDCGPDPEKHPGPGPAQGKPGHVFPRRSGNQARHTIDPAAYRPGVQHLLVGVPNLDWPPAEDLSQHLGPQPGGVGEEVAGRQVV